MWQFPIQRRLLDYQFSLPQTPAAFEQVHQTCLHLYNTTAPQGLLKDTWAPAIPLRVLGQATGRRESPEDLRRQFSRALLPRTTPRYGCVT